MYIPETHHLDPRNMIECEPCNNKNYDIDLYNLI